MTLRLGLIGRGRWGKNIERTLISFPDVSVIAISRGERPPSDLDGVLIVSPGATHAELAIPYIETGIATFIEKPMATSVADAERIRQAANRSGAVVFVGHIFLYNPVFITALKILPALGAVRYMLCEGMNNDYQAASSVLWEWLPHALSMARAIFGNDPECVETWSLVGASVPQAAVSKFLFGSTPVVSVMSGLSPLRQSKLTIIGERAVLVFDDKAERKLILYNTDGAISYPAYSDELPLTREIGAFLKAVRTGETDAPHIETGVAIVRMIAAAEDFIRCGGRPVTL